MEEEKKQQPAAEGTAKQPAKPRRKRGNGKKRASQRGRKAGPRKDPAPKAAPDAGVQAEPAPQREAEPAPPAAPEPPRQAAEPAPAVQAVPAEQTEPAEMAEPAEPGELLKPDAPEESGEPVEHDGPGREPQAGPEAPDGEPVEPKPEDPAEQQRLADMTRTVQVSIEQILAAQAEAQPPEEPKPARRRESLGVRLGKGLANAVLRLLRWLLLVLALVAMIAGMGVGWLYHNATSDLLPSITVELAGQRLVPTAYSWHVPVVGNLLRRTYSNASAAAPLVLETALEDSSPDLEITPAGYETNLIVLDEAGDTVFEGTAEKFRTFSFGGNGSYTGTLVLARNPSEFSTGAEVTGSQIYQFAFSINVRPSIRLSTSAVLQGGVAAVRVTGTRDGDQPTLRTNLSATGFVRDGAGWVAYLPIEWDRQPGDYELRIQTRDYEQRVTLSVREHEERYREYTSNSQLVSPCITPENTPKEVLALLETCDDTLAWRSTGFVRPLVASAELALPFGTTEYVGNAVQRTAVRTVRNAVFSGSRGDALIAPAGGRVLLAQNLGGTAGNTLVIEHGAGLKSIFYGLRTLEVAEGQVVEQGDTLGATDRYTIAEMRIGEVEIDPQPVWQNSCDALKGNG